ncbi:MAG: hypothetical protein OEY24_02925 [Candidatus Bathyarchaeota archaeon]|nr:hypothetical protein [Candidatus Bathyarchaeota archaeon]MDH5494641.1 hypothetical protein [Candidatus Bathyarchaeota archaeon]
MSEVKPNTEKILQRLSEVLDVLKRLSEDLQDISKSLKTITPTTAPTAAPPATPLAPTPQPGGKRIEDLRMMFTKELETMLIFEDKGDFIKITPRQYLGPENFAKIASTIREAGGEYVSAGKGSHFRIPK